MNATNLITNMNVKKKQGDPVIQIKGEDVDSALREWVKNEIKNSPSKVYDLGKFFFGVSGTTAGLILTLEKLEINPELNWPLVFSLLMYLLSIILSLYMAIPKLWRVEPEADLRIIHKNQVEKSIHLIWLWLALWVIGTGLGILALS